MKHYRYILFDLDGTLTLSHSGIFHCLTYTLEKMGFPDAPESVLQKWIGPPITQSFQELFAMTDEQAKLATQIYREHYGERGWAMNEIMPYALDCVKQLHAHGYVLGLATSKPKKFSDKITEKFGFTPYLSVQVGCGLDGSLPTKAAVIERAMELLGAKKEECLMVGDRQHDVFGARECGIAVAGLQSGYAQAGEMQNAAPDYLFEDLRELTAWLIDEKA